MRKPRLLAHGRPRDARSSSARSPARPACATRCMVNSGSSANLLAFMALTSPQLGDRGSAPATRSSPLRPVSPPPSTRSSRTAVPVFVDVSFPTYNIDRAARGRGLEPDARVMIAHTLGNPFDLAAVTISRAPRPACLIEDCCDALGATYQGSTSGTFGDLATLQLLSRPSHHHGRGRRGLTNRDGMKRLVESFRDWGRDCWCARAATTPAASASSSFGQLPCGTITSTPTRTSATT